MRRAAGDGAASVRAGIGAGGRATFDGAAARRRRRRLRHQAGHGVVPGVVLGISAPGIGGLYLDRSRRLRRCQRLDHSGRGLGRARARQRIGKHGRRHRNDAAEHRRRMTPGLQEQRVGEDGADRGGSQQARNHVLRAVQQYPHGKATLGLGCNRPGAPAAAARHLVIVFKVNPSRHFSSPGGVAVLMRYASRASASRCCWRARATSAA